jgi:hypothetical protein
MRERVANKKLEIQFIASKDQIAGSSNTANGEFPEQSKLSKALIEGGC